MRHFRPSLLIVLFAGLSLLASGIPFPAYAQGPSGTGPADARDVQSFVDPIIGERMAGSHIPGLVLVVVRDGQVLYEKGYGSADLANRTPMTPDRSVLRVFSISKVFTATAIMQLVEQGRLDLNENVNKYLKHFQIPDPFPQPITIANLLTHTAGLDGDNLRLGALTKSPGELVPMDSYLAAHTLSPLWAPGQRYLYSNTAYAVLGQVVEDVSGRPFAQYVDESILKPLGMTHTSFLQPSPLAGDVAVTYKYTNGSLLSVPASYSYMPPAAGLTATGDDVAHFMIALLQGGEYQGAHILQAATVQDLERQHFAYQAGEPGMAFGFQGLFWPAGALWKDGGGPNNPTSRIVLLPEQHLGFFISYNSDDDFELAGGLSNQFLFHYFPYSPSSALPISAGSKNDVARLTGIYRSADYAHLTVAKLLTLLNGDYPEVVQSGGAIAIRWSGEQDNIPPLVETGPLTFEGYYAEYGNLPFHVVFREGPDHEIAQMSLGLNAYEKVPWYETAKVQQALLVLFTLIFLAAPLATLVWFVRNRRAARNRTALLSGAGRMVQFLPGLIGALNVAFLLLLGWTLLNAFDPHLDLVFGPPIWFLAILTIPIVTTILILALAGLLLLTWRARRSAISRVLFTSFLIAALAFIPFLLYWNLLGYHY